MDSERKVSILYTNWRGERRWRDVIPDDIRFMESIYHPGKQWILLAIDCEENKLKEFAMSGIEAWGKVGAQIK